MSFHEERKKKKEEECRNQNSLKAFSELIFWFTGTLVEQMILYRFIFSKAPRHFIFSNVWCICVVFKFLGFYPLKRIGNSELIPTSKCQFRLIYILSFIIAFAPSVCFTVFYFTEIPFECWTKSVNATVQAFPSEVTYMIFVSVETIIKIFIIPIYYIYHWNTLQKGLSILQYDFNSIELIYPDHSHNLPTIASDKIQHRSKTMIRLICIIPGILILIGNGIQTIGGEMISFDFLSATVCSSESSDIKPYFLPIKVFINIVLAVFFVIIWYYFYVIYVDILHLILSWSNSILNTQRLQRSEIIFHSESFIKMLNNFNKIISPFIFMLVFSGLIFSIFDCFYFVYGNMQSLKNQMVGNYILTSNYHGSTLTIYYYYFLDY